MVQGLVLRRNVMKSLFVVIGVVAVLLAVAGGASADTTIYSQNFESLNTGDAVSLLPGWINRRGTVVVNNTTEMGKAVDASSAGNVTPIADLNLADAAVNAVPTLGNGKWTYSADAYVYTASGTVAPAEMDSGNVTGGIRWGNLEYNGGDSWRARFYAPGDPDNAVVTSNFNDGAGAVNHVASVQYILDMTTLQQYYKINGVESAKSTFDPACLPTFTQASAVWWGANKGLIDNVRIGVDIITPEPASMVMVATALLGLLAYAWRKRK
jgi:hypothetical protein